ncbi:MAG: S-methyl-5'-thioadenosine phosphorylase [Oligoflexales bacterium]|nr:S-methyl-5'-thioadenosine phosphorylase [Oligoflexales bacterium]
MSEQNEPVVLGVIGGSGLYKMDQAKIVKEHEICTPFGKPSDLVVETEIGGKKVFFLPRHGKGHSISPTEIPFRANIAAMKQCGVSHLLAISAVGIMREDISPGDMILPDQIIDVTKGMRSPSFFGKGAVGHVLFADPFCSQFRELCFGAASAKAKKVHDSGTYICVEGPRFSSRAESHYFRRTMEPSCIGMTAHPEAPLAKEAELSYALLGLATDYDCWHETEEDVTVEAVLQVLKNNAKTANEIVVELTKSLPNEMPRPLKGTMSSMLVTNRDMIPIETKRNLEYLYGDMFKA